MCIHSGKHDSSTPYTNAYNIRELFKCGLVEAKPILIFMPDGTSDIVLHCCYTIQRIEVRCSFAWGKRCRII